MVQDGKLRGFAMGQAIPVRLHRRRGSPFCPASERCCAGATTVSDCGRARRRLAGRGGHDRWHGSSDAAGLGDPVQRAGTGRSHQYPFSGSAAQAQLQAQGLSRRIVEEGPIPAIHGVVRWRACDLITRLYEEFGLSVSDDTIYRALKKLGFSHMSARPKAYKQNAEAMDAFKKTSPGVWRKSARSLQPTHR